MSRVSRRTVLRAGVAVGVLVVAPAGPAGAVEPRLRLEPAAFTPYIGRSFALVGGGTRVHARLAEVEELAMPGAAPAHTGFSLLFEAPVPLPGQGIYRLHNPQAGQVDLFVVPVDRPGRHHHLQCIIHRRASVRRVVGGRDV